MECKTLSDICLRICSGGTPKRSCREYYDGGTIPWLNTAEVNFNRIRSTASHITEQGLDNSSARWVPKDTVIVAMYGAAAGRVAIAGIPLTTNQACCNLVIDCALADPKYVYYWLKNKYCEIAGLANGGAQQNLGVSVLKEVEIVPPTLSVQHAVADYLAVLDEKIELNSRINDHLAGLCESITVNTSADEKTTLADISSQVTTKIAYDEAAIDSYVSTESLLPNKGGRQLASSLPTTGKVTSFKPGDTLVSNIRPYFKKVWYADRNGTCSNDVVVFRAKEPSLAPYLYSILRSDSFFEHVMAGAKGTKMPRGDKKQMMQYRVSKCCDENNLRLLSSMLGQISSNNRESGRIAELRDALLPKLMSGEIDISRIDIKQLNGHLFES